MSPTALRTEGFPDCPNTNIALPLLQTHCKVPTFTPPRKAQLKLWFKGGLQTYTKPLPLEPPQWKPCPCGGCSFTPCSRADPPRGPLLDPLRLGGAGNLQPGQPPAHPKPGEPFGSLQPQPSVGRWSLIHYQRYKTKTSGFSASSQSELCANNWVTTGQQRPVTGMLPGWTSECLRMSHVTPVTHTQLDLQATNTTEWLQ